MISRLPESLVQMRPSLTFKGVLRPLQSYLATLKHTQQIICTAFPKLKSVLKLWRTTLLLLSYKFYFHCLNPVLKSLILPSIMYSVLGTSIISRTVFHLYFPSNYNTIWTLFHFSPLPPTIPLLLLIKPPSLLMENCRFTSSCGGPGNQCLEKQCQVNLLW